MFFSFVLLSLLAFSYGAQTSRQLGDPGSILRPVFIDNGIMVTMHVRPLTPVIDISALML